MLRGTVVGSESGFYYGRSGVMLAIIPDGPQLRASAYAAEDSFYLFYPAEDVPMGSTRICHRRQYTPRLPPTPEVGDDVIVFPHRERPRHPGMPIVSVGLRGDDFLYEHQGEIRLPSLLRRRFDGVRQAASMDELWGLFTEAFDGTRRTAR